MLPIDTTQITQLQPVLKVLSAAGQAVNSTNAATSRGLSAENFVTTIRPPLEAFIRTVAEIEGADRSGSALATPSEQMAALITVIGPFLPILRHISDVVSGVASEVNEAQRASSVQLAEHLEEALDSFEDIVEAWALAANEQTREWLGNVVEQAKGLPKDFPHWSESLAIVPD